MTLKWRALTLVSVFFGITALAYAKPPMESLRKPMDMMITILNDPQYRGQKNKGAQREELWKIISTIFDFREMSKRALGRNWKRFDPRQRDKFTDVFAKLLGNIYLDKIQGGYRNEGVVFLDEKMVKASRAIVKTKIVRETVEIPIHYRMHQQKKGWQIYDVNIEGVGLVKNYRTQFNKILRKESPERLIERIKKKIKQQKTKK